MERKRDSSHLMTEREWEEFWSVVDSDRRPLRPPSKAHRLPVPSAAEAEEEAEDQSAGDALDAAASTARHTVKAHPVAGCKMRVELT